MYYSKTVFDANGPLRPQATFELSMPDGTKITDVCDASLADSSYARDKCAVKIGPCTFEGDLHAYTIHYENNGIVCDVLLEGVIPAWRHGCGTKYWGAKEDKTFAWLAAVPDGKVTAAISINGEVRCYSGTGYHDHNWGTANMAELIHHWYWGRASVGPYNIISACVFSEKQYGYYPIKTFMIAREGNIIVGESDAADYLTFSTKDFYRDSLTNKPVAKTVVFDYRRDGAHYRITYRREDDILQYKLIDTLSGLTKFGARLIGFDGAYIRFIGNVTVERFEGESVVESITEPAAVWELMYLGKTIPESEGASV